MWKEWHKTSVNLPGNGNGMPNQLKNAPSDYQIAKNRSASTLPFLNFPWKCKKHTSPNQKAIPILHIAQFR